MSNFEVYWYQSKVKATRWLIHFKEDKPNQQNHVRIHEIKLLKIKDYLCKYIINPQTQIQIYTSSIFYTATSSIALKKRL